MEVTTLIYDLRSIPLLLLIKPYNYGEWYSAYCCSLQLKGKKKKAMVGMVVILRGHWRGMTYDECQNN